MGRGLTDREQELVEALELFMDDFGVNDIDIEEKVPGYSVVCYRRNRDIAFSAWGKTREEAITNVVRSASSGRR